MPTPNFARLAEKTITLDTSYVCSMPCMPARHDILCGALDFLWKPWGSIEIFEQPLTAALRLSGLSGLLVLDSAMQDAELGDLASILQNIKKQQ